MKHLLANILASAVALGIATAAAGPADPRPNILFLFTDDQRADTIAALGNPIIQTPNLDRLCHDGLAFTRAYMQGSFNGAGATCVPSRAMLLSGQSLFHVDEKLLRDETWPAAFGQAGYTTFMTGKWHNGEKSFPVCFQAGRSIRIGGYPFVNGAYTPMHAPVSDLKNGSFTKPHPVPSHPSAVYADEVIRFLREPQGGRPFFCYVPLDGPHDPHIVPDDYPVHYDPARIPLPPNFLPQHPFDNGEMHVRDEELMPHPRSPQAVRQNLADYYRYVSYLDMLIGRMLAALDASPYASNTIVVFSADSGVALGSHGLLGKQNLYEYDSVRVPLIAAGPSIPAGKTTEAMCYLYDVLPTLGAMCGVPAPPKSDGLDLSGVWRDPRSPGRTELIFAYKGVQRAVETADWKLIRYPKVNQTQLFNLKNDPYEIHNLAGQPELAAKAKEMLARLRNAQKEYGDSCPPGP